MNVDHGVCTCGPPTQQGDPLAAREVVQEKALALRREFDTVARDVSAELAVQKKALSRQLERHQVGGGWAGLGPARIPVVRTRMGLDPDGQNR